MLFQGIAWVDSNNYQIVLLRTDLLKPLNEAGLKRSTPSTEYGEVSVRGVPGTFWLPQKVDVFISYRGKTFRNRHTYSNFRLFKVESTIRVDEDKSR